MDNQATDPINVDQAGSMFAQMFEAQEAGEHEQADQEQQAVETQQAESEPVQQEQEFAEIEVNGKKVQLPKDIAQTIESERMMRKNYTQKTMATAEDKKAVAAEREKALQERQHYQAELNKLQAVLEHSLSGVTQEQLVQLETDDPAEYIKVQALIQQRQAKLNEIYQAQHQLNAQQQAEQEQHKQDYLRQQTQLMVDKLPEWKDQGKAEAELAQIGNFIQSQGFSNNEFGYFMDHRAMLLARKAMLYDQIMNKTNLAEKKVAQVPTKVIKPGSGNSQPSDKVTQAKQQAMKSGRVEDAGRWMIEAGII